MTELSRQASIILGMILVLLLIGWVGFTAFYSAPTPPPTQTHVQPPEILGERRLTDEPWDIFWWSPDGTQLLLMRVEYGSPAEVQAPPDGTQEALIVDARLVILEIDTGEMTSIPQPGIWALWSPEGNGILIRDRAPDPNEDQFYLYSLEDGSSQRLKFPRNTTPVLWLEEGLVYQAEDGLWLLEMPAPDLEADAEGELTIADPIQLLVYDASDYARWSIPAPDLQTFVLSDNTDLEDRHWWLVQKNGERREMEPALYGLGVCCRWSPDGSHLAYFGITPQGQNLYLVDRGGDDKQVLVSGAELGQRAFLTLDFSPDSKQLIFVHSPAGPGFPFDNNQLYSVNTDGSGLKRLTSPGEGPYNWLSWSPDGRHIASMDAHNRVWIAEISRR